jgi:hypothetical protein
MQADTPYNLTSEFCKRVREFTDDELSEAIHGLRREVFGRSTLGGRPQLSLYFANQWVRNLDQILNRPDKRTNEVIEHSTDWPMIIPAHSKKRKAKVEELTKGRLKRLGHKSGLNLASPKQFDLASPANLVAYNLYIWHYQWRFIEEPIENPVSVQSALKTGGDQKIRDAFSAAIQKLPRLSSKNCNRWMRLIWKWGQYVNKENILNWNSLKPLIKSLSKEDRTPSVVYSRLQKGFKAIAQRA